MSDDGEDLDGFLLDEEDSDVASSGRYRNQATSSRPRRKQRSKPDDGRVCLSSSDSGDGRGRAASDANNRGSSEERHQSRRYKKKDRERTERRKMERDMELALSSGDDDDVAPARTKGPSRLKPKPSTLATSTGRKSSALEMSPDDRFQPGDKVEARFGGRSRWFVGKIRRAHEGRSGEVLYDIAYDDGDKEEGVLGGRVRRPGQISPVLQQGVQVEIKLTRKGKGYHPGVIGRVNDDGSLYVMLDDGDAEWGVPAQHIIATYSYTPAAQNLPEEETTAFPKARHTVSEENRDDRGDHGRAREHDSTGNEPGEDPSKAAATLSRNPPSTLPVPGGESVTTAGRSSAETSPPNSAADHYSAPQEFPTTTSISGGVGCAQKDVTGISPPGCAALTASASVPPTEEETPEGGGLSWIAKVANSVGASGPQPSAPPTPDPPADGEGGGLKWIAHVADSVGASPRGNSPGVTGIIQGATTIPGDISPLQNPCFLPAGSTTPNPVAAASAAGAAAAAYATPRAGNTPPTHLEWKPSRDASVHRRWGAPPPDEPEPMITDNTPPPQLSGSVVPAGAVAPTAVHPAASASHTPTRQQAPHEMARSSALNAEGPQVGGATADLGERPQDSFRTGSGVFKGQAQSALQSAGHRASITGARSDEHGAAGCETEESDPAGGEGTRKSLQSPTNASSASKMNSDTGVSSEGVSPQLKGKVGAASGWTGKTQSKRSDANDDRTRWENLRVSVQRRYAAEAMHLSEEVRLLKAKLRAADDNTQAKLAKQERNINQQLERAIEREQEKMQAALSGERAASARRVIGLKEEVDYLKQRLDVERRRAAKREGDGSTAVRRRDRSPSSYATDVIAGPNASRMKRAARSSEGTFPSSGRNSSSRILKRPGSTTPRPRSERHLPPPPPPPPPPPLRSRRSVPGGVKNSMLGGPSAGVFPSADTFGSAASADGPAFDSLMKSFLEGLASRDESIRELTARLHRMEGEHGAASSPPWVKAPREGTGQQHLADEDYREARATYAWNAEEQNEIPLPRQRRETRPDGFGNPGSIDGGGGTLEASLGISAAVHAEEAFSQRNRDDSDERRADAYARRWRRDREGQHPHRKADDREGEDYLRWKIVEERRDARKRLETMKAEVQRVVGQFRARAERAEAVAASAEEKARIKALRYIAGKYRGAGGGGGLPL